MKPAPYVVKWVLRSWCEDPEAEPCDYSTQEASTAAEGRRLYLAAKRDPKKADVCLCERADVMDDCLGIAQGLSYSWRDVVLLPLTDKGEVR